MDPSAYSKFEADLASGTARWTRDLAIDYLSNAGYSPAAAGWTSLGSSGAALWPSCAPSRDDFPDDANRIAPSLRVLS